MLIPLLQAVLEGLSKDRHWQCKEGALKALRKLATAAKQQVQEALPDIVPVGSECLVDAREQVGTPWPCCCCASCPVASTVPGAWGVGHAS